MNIPVCDAALILILLTCGGPSKEKKREKRPEKDPYSSIAKG